MIQTVLSELVKYGNRIKRKRCVFFSVTVEVHSLFLLNGKYGNDVIPLKAEFLDNSRLAVTFQSRACLRSLPATDLFRALYILRPGGDKLSLEICSPSA